MHLKIIESLSKNFLSFLETPLDPSLVTHLSDRLSAIFDSRITQLSSSSTAANFSSNVNILSDVSPIVEFSDPIDVTKNETQEALLKKTSLEGSDVQEFSVFYDNFLSVVTIEGNEAFIEKTTAIIKKMHQTRLGSHLLHMIVNTDKRFKIVQNDEKSFQREEAVEFCLFGKNSFCITVDENGVQKMEKIPKIVTLFHELVHMHHQNTSYSGEFVERGKRNTSLEKDMHNAEEELTICGEIRGGGNFLDTPEDLSRSSVSIISTLGKKLDYLGELKDSLNENAFRKELNLNPRVNHSGIILGKGLVPTPIETLYFLYDQNLMRRVIDEGNDSPSDVMSILYKQEDVEMTFHFIKKSRQNFIEFCTSLFFASKDSKIKFFQKMLHLFVENEVKIKSSKMFKSLINFGYIIPFNLLNFSFSPQKALLLLLQSKNPKLEEVQQLISQGAKLPSKVVDQRTFFSIEWLLFLKSCGQPPSTRTLHLYLNDWNPDLSIIEWIVRQGIKPTQESMDIAKDLEENEIFCFLLRESHKID